jgi:glutamyl-Q tRNA(Asp) synthetase
MINSHRSNKKHNNYTGRFAPSPTGPLHFGSLVAAVASYLDAKYHRGEWLIRIEDLDPPREAAGAVDTILKQLEGHGLHWDSEILYQSQRGNAYQDSIEQLSNQQLCYPCNCNRKRIASLSGHYDGHCLITPPQANTLTAIRLRTNLSPDHGLVEFNDIFQGPQKWNLPNSDGDFIIKRKDQLFAYQLACTVDDIHQQITHVIRGSDLLDSTPRQIHIMRTLGHLPPNYGHIPVAISPNGIKLSKQNLATAIDNDNAVNNLLQAQAWLNIPTPKELQEASVEEVLRWGCQNWRRENISPTMSILAPETHQQA